jgi:hypothetical protein
MLHSVGAIEFGVELDGFNRRSLQSHLIDMRPGLRADALHLQGAGQRFRVVLQRDDPQHRRGIEIDQHQSSLQ